MFSYLWFPACQPSSARTASAARRLISAWGARFKIDSFPFIFMARTGQNKAAVIPGGAFNFHYHLSQFLSRRRLEAGCQLSWKKEGKNPIQTTNPNQKCAKNMASRWLFLFCCVWGSHRSRISYQGGISLLRIWAESLSKAAYIPTLSHTRPVYLTHFWYLSYSTQCQPTLCSCACFAQLDTTTALIQTCRRVPPCKDLSNIKARAPSLIKVGQGDEAFRQGGGLPRVETHFLSSS